MQAGVLYTLHLSHETCYMTLPWCVVLHPLACKATRALGFPTSKFTPSAVDTI
jgi:hypothetical protein